MELMLIAGTALWVGIMTSISPCPLATNIAAITFISKQISSKKMILATGILYTLGRVLVYVLLVALVFKSAIMIPEISTFLQNKMHKILGPLLIVVGMCLSELVSLNFPAIKGVDKLRGRFQHMGIWGALPLGAMFALSFCPTSAALFFGSLIPLASKASSLVILPTIYGFGTGVPVFIFALLIAFGVGWIGRVYNKIKVFECWFRKGTGIVFIVVGIYFCLVYIFQFPLWSN